MRGVLLLVLGILSAVQLAWSQQPLQILRYPLSYDHGAGPTSPTLQPAASGGECYYPIITPEQLAVVQSSHEAMAAHRRPYVVAAKFRHITRQIQVRESYVEYVVTPAEIIPRDIYSITVRPGYSVYGEATYVDSAPRDVNVMTRPPYLAWRPEDPAGPSVYPDGRPEIDPNPNEVALERREFMELYQVPAAWEKRHRVVRTYSEPGVDHAPPQMRQFQRFTVKPATVTQRLVPALVEHVDTYELIEDARVLAAMEPATLEIIYKHILADPSRVEWRTVDCDGKTAPVSVPPPCPEAPSAPTAPVLGVPSQSTPRCPPQK